MVKKPRETRSHPTQLPANRRVKAIRSTILKLTALSRWRCSQSIQTEMLMLYWEIGGILEAQAVGEKDLARLAAGLADRAKLMFKPEVLLAMRRFAKAYPDWGSAHRECFGLLWGYMVGLMQIKDSAQREDYTRRSQREGWTLDELKRQIAARRARSGTF